MSKIINGMDTKGGETLQDSYKPNKSERNARRKVWERYQDMSTDPLRKDAEAEWDMADILFRQWVPTPDEDDWRTNLVLPDAFSGVQAQMQESLDRKSRPILRRVESSDDALEQFYNAILNYNMDRTGFDFQYFLAKYSASIRGSAFLFDYYRVDKRTVKDPDSVDDEGNIVYKDKEIIDFDDDYTEHIENEFIFIDNRVNHLDKAQDMVRREVLDIDEFKRVYGAKADFKNVDKVQRGGDTSQKAFFQMPSDMDEDEVEVLHYINRATDEYNVLANNVLVRMGPMPWKHKELPIAMIHQYYIPGRIWGMGIPKVIFSLTEERRSLRMLNLDRQKMQLNKMVFVNDSIDLDDDDLVTRPFGMISVNTGGLSMQQSVMPMEYGDVPASYFRTEEILLEDIRRAHGIDDRIMGNNVGGTATEAAILKESSQKRINMVAQLAEIDGLKRIGKLKWSNLQFFYPAPRVEKIIEKNEEKTNKTYKKIQVKGKEFVIGKNEVGEQVLQMNEVAGTTSFELNKSFARFINTDDDVVMDVEAHQVLSKPIQQAKITEMFTSLSTNPSVMGELDTNKAARRYIEINDEDPKDWLKGGEYDPEAQRRQAAFENELMLSGYPLPGTPHATQAHTEVHLDFTASSAYENAPFAVQQIFQHHILAEHNQDPARGSAADAMKAGGAAATDPNNPLSGLEGPGAGGPNNPMNQMAPPSMPQPADITPQGTQGGGSGNPSGEAQV